MRRSPLHVARPLGRKGVALIVETSLAPGREILRGIASYVREAGPWSIEHEPRTLEQSVPRWLRRWSGDGIIARVQNQRVARAIAAARIPVIDVLGMVEGPTIGRGGYEGARLLATLMQGGPKPLGPTLLAPNGVRARMSTDALAVDDRDVAQPLRHIREHGCEAIDVDDVVRHGSAT